MKPEQIAGTSEHSQRNKLRAIRIWLGICRDCGIKSLRDGSKCCEKCFNARKQASKRRQLKVKLSGVCSRCGVLSNYKTVCKKCMDIQIEQYRIRRKENKLLIIYHFGGKCIECGENDIRCLSLDHINNDGKIDKISGNGKRQVTPTWYAKLARLIKFGKELPRQLQLLCFNCHAKKDLQPWWFE